MVPVAAFAAGGWWVGLSVASVLIAVLAALVVTVVTLVNRIELQAMSITDSLTATGERTRPLLDLVEANVSRSRCSVARWRPCGRRQWASSSTPSPPAPSSIGRPSGSASCSSDCGAVGVAPGARDVAGHLAATFKAATGLQSALDAVLRP